jgi:hypothetical protein
MPSRPPSAASGEDESFLFFSQLNRALHSYGDSTGIFAIIRKSPDFPFHPGFEHGNQIGANVKCRMQNVKCKMQKREISEPTL